MSISAELDNRTPFCATFYPLVGSEGEDDVLLVVACSFEGFSGTSAPAQEAWVPQDVDVF